MPAFYGSSGGGVAPMLGAGGGGGMPMGGAPFEAGLMSDAESRVTDWIQQQQRGFISGAATMENDDASQDADTDPESVFQSLQADRHRLKLGSLLQEGTFGRVYQVCITKLTCYHQKALPLRLGSYPYLRT